MRALVLLMLGLSACALPGAHRASDPPPGDVRFTAPGLYPEGVAFDAVTGSFYVSSFRYGTVGRVTADGGYQPFTGPGPLFSTFGLAVDTQRRRLLAAGGDLGVGIRTGPETLERQGGLAVYDLETGALHAFVPLDRLVPGRHLTNDLALDADGNAYVTDSFAGAVYRVTPEGEAAVLAASPAFASAGGVGANGIAVHPDGFLLVAHFSEGALFRIPLADPAHAERVALPEPYVGADGLVLLDARRLVVVQNEGHDRTLLLRSDDGWRSAALDAAVPSVLPFPTTATRVGAAVYVLNARLEDLFDEDPATRSSDFLLQRVAF